jgi:O-antigen ligase
MRQIAESIYNFLTHENFLYVIALALFLGIYYSRAAVSISVVTIGLIGLFTVVQAKKRQVILKDRSLLALTAVFVVFLLSGLVSANTGVWFEHLKSNTTFLAVPFGMWAFGPFDRKTLVRLILIYIVITCFSAVAVMIDYAGHFDEYNDLYKVGKSIPTPVMHIRYSYFLALAAICSIGLLLDKLVLDTRYRIATGVMAAFIVVCLHILAVRTGLLALYGGIITLGVLVVIREGKWKIAIGALGLIVILAFLSVKLLPSAFNKLGYVMYDLNKLKQGVSPDYSDNVRITSIRHGLKIFRENPAIGVGVGDISDVIKEVYTTDTPMVPDDRKYDPISQFVYWLATYGLLGTILIGGLLLYPLKKYGRHSYLLWGIYTITAFSFIGETPFQWQLGKAIFLMLLTIVLRSEYLKLNNKLPA